MASIISAGTTSGTSLNLSGDTSGVLQLATNGSTTAITVDTSQNVGIGTTSPSFVAGGGLQVSNATQANLRLSDTTNAAYNFDVFMNDADGYLYNRTSGFMAFGTNNTERMRITSGGDVGIGTSSPSRKLTVIGKAQFTSSTSANEIYIADTGSSSVDNQGIGSSGNDIRIITGGLERMRVTSAGLFGFGLSDPTTFSSGVAQAVIERTSAGNNTVALALVNRSGTANTSVSLDFNPNTNIALAQIRAFRTDTGFGGATDFRFLNYDGSALAERMRLSSAGTLFIGATSSPNGVQRLVLTADGNAGTEPLLINELRASNSNENAIRFYRNGSQVGTITTNASNTSYNTSSDYRLKENIAPMTGALAKVQQLKPCTYTWKVDGSDGQGFIAHELQAVVPDAVNGEKDAVDAEGKPVYQGVDTSFLVATLTAAIQELKAELDATKAEVAALKGVN